MARRKTTTASPKLEEVTDLEASGGSEGSALTLEAGLIFTTFLALIVGVVLAQKLLARYGFGFFA